MRKLLLILLSTFQTVVVWTQNTDSLKYILATTKSDSIKIATLSTLANYYGWAMPDTALKYSQQELLLARKRNWEKWEMDAMGTYGDCMYIAGNYAQALNYLLPVLQSAEKQNDTTTMLNAFFALSSTYRDIGDYKHALYHASSAQNIAQRTHQKIKLAEAKGILGSIYEAAGQLDSALFFAERAYALDSMVNGAPVVSFIPYVLGNIYRKKQNYTPALWYYRKSVVLDFRSNNMKDVMDGYNGMAKVFRNTHQLDSAIYYGNQVFAVGSSVSYPLGLLEACKTLSELYKDAHKSDSVLKYNDLAAAIQDSIFNKERVTQFQSVSFSEQLRRQDIETAQRLYKNKIKQYVLLAGVGILLLFAALLYRSNWQKQKANEEISKAYQQLKSAQAQLIQREKMASLGELTAGIAHEIQNPLNFVNNFSETNVELLEELKQEVEAGNLEEVKVIADDVIANEKKINHHGRRTDSIVKGMLEHSRTSNGQKELTDINKLADEYLRLSYHGLRAKDKNFNAGIKTGFDAATGKLNVVPQEIGRVLLNLFNNAFYAVKEKKKLLDDSYEPTISISTKRLQDKIEITVQDNGMGISKSLMDKIFQPFFTTKPTGEGTGLGLSLSYDIIKAHGGELRVDSSEGEGSVFTISLPLHV